MRRLLAVILLTVGFVTVSHAADGHVYKVLPQFLDKEGRHATSPSLYDRDAYQNMLLHNPSKRGGIRYAIEWKGSSKSKQLKLRVELRGVSEGDVPNQKVLELPVEQHSWFSHWAYLTLDGEDYKSFGNVTAWRATLWDGDKLLGEQKSFLWSIDR